jgi:hypothetical protein
LNPGRRHYGLRALDTSRRRRFGLRRLGFGLRRLRLFLLHLDEFDVFLLWFFRLSNARVSGRV